VWRVRKRPRCSCARRAKIVRRRSGCGAASATKEVAARSRPRVQARQERAEGSAICATKYPDSFLHPRPRPFLSARPSRKARATLHAHDPDRMRSKLADAPQPALDLSSAANQPSPMRQLAWSAGPKSNRSLLAPKRGLEWINSRVMASDR